jgi:hypothetical protein
MATLMNLKVTSDSQNKIDNSLFCRLNLGIKKTDTIFQMLKIDEVNFLPKFVA